MTTMSSTAALHNTETLSVSTEDSENPEMMESLDNTARSPSLNPQQKLRARLMAEGFTADEVNTATEEMWNKQLAYDDFDAVIAYLRPEPQTAEKDSNQEVDTRLEENTAATTSVSTSPAMTDEVSVHSTVAEEDNVPEPKRLSNGSDNEAKPHGTPPRYREPRTRSMPHSLDLASKLDLVADYENLVDAAFALTEWATKAAKPHELEDFCTADKTLALPTVVKRAILECKDQSRFEDSVLPAVLHMIGSILMQAGLSSAAVSSTRKALDPVLKRSRALASSTGENDSVFAGRVAKFIVSRVSLAVHTCKFTNSEEGVENIQKLEDEIESMASSLASSLDRGVAELIAKRDMHKIAAEKSAHVVDLAVSSVDKTNASSKEQVEPRDHPAVVEMGRNEILLTIVGDKGLKKFDKNRLEYAELEEKAESIQAKNKTKSSELDSTLKEYEGMKKTLGSKIEELRKALKAAEEEQELLCEKINVVHHEKKMIENSEELQTVKMELCKKGELVQYGDSVESLAESLKSFDDSLERAVSSKPALDDSADKEDYRELMGNKMDVYLVRIRNYFASEVECIEFLRMRMKALQKESKELTREMDECSVLGMDTTVSQMAETLSLYEQNIRDDHSVVKGLCDEASKMREVLVNTLERYTTVDSGDFTGELTSLHRAVLRGIALSIRRIGLSDDDSLDGFLKDEKVESRTETVAATKTEESIEPVKQREEAQEQEPNEGKKETSEEPSSIKEGSRDSDPLKAKLKWAVAARVKEEKVSLLDIQKEELLSKNQVKEEHDEEVEAVETVSSDS